jgi:hypothetical protein
MELETHNFMRQLILTSYMQQVKKEKATCTENEIKEQINRIHILSLYFMFHLWLQHKYTNLEVLEKSYTSKCIMPQDEFILLSLL